MDRRAFVKTCVATAAAATATAAGVVGFSSAVIPRAPPVQSYVGARVVGGPAWRGVPYIPVRVEEGFLVAKTGFRWQGSDRDALAPLAYCRTSPERGPVDDTLVFLEKDDYKIVTPWFAPLLGKPMRADAFPDAGFGAPFLWRGVPGVVVRVAREELRRLEAAERDGRPLSRPEFRAFVDAFAPEGFVAVAAACTHFCCTAAWNEAERLARPRNGWDKLYCTCHGAIFDVRTPMWYDHDAGLPEQRQ